MNLNQQGRCMDRLSLMEYFVRAVETGSFSAVAREFGIGQPNVSRYIAALEQRLGTRLLHRSTRKLTLTPEGERYFTDVKRVLDAVAEADSLARGEDEPGGLLRIACSSSLGRDYVLPAIGSFLERYPKVGIDVQISDRFVDLVEEGVDLAIRIGILKDSALRARRIGTAERVCVASPAYLARHPAPRVPQDLQSHECVIYTLLSSGRVWTFRDAEVEVRGRFLADTPDGIYRGVLDGFGIAYAPVWLFERAVLDGRLQLVLLDHLGPPMPIQVIYSGRRLVSRRASTFTNFIAEEVGRLPSLNEGALSRLLNSAGGSRVR
jgi:LysR family transcriptional regulator, regulator for bpeEF and oprC